MSAKKLKRFDLEEVYDAEISPLMAQIIEICKAHKMPMFATFLYRNDPDGDDGLCTTNILFADERPVPEAMLKLAPSLTSPRGPAMRMRVTKGDGSVEDMVIL